MAAEYFPVNYELKQKIELSGHSFIHQKTMVSEILKKISY